MIDLSLPLHLDWMGGLTIADYLDRLLSLGITAVEVQLPPTLAVPEIERWMALIDQVRERQLKLAIHVPIALDPAMVGELSAWIEPLATSPLTLIVHGSTAGQPTPDLAAQTASCIRSLLRFMPPTVTVAVEQGWNWGMMAGLGSSIRNLRSHAGTQRMQRRRPAGVGSGMGAAPAPTAQLKLPAAAEFDPPLKHRWWRIFKRAGGFSGTGTREATLQVVMEVNQPNCVIAWDLAHDWLGGTKAGVSDWHSTPAADFLDRVGYVRLHDVDDRGCDHWPLVIGNVPYASQLRPLLRHNFAGTVCLAIRYTPQMHAFGNRWHVLERSLAVTRQVLRLN